MNVIPLLLLLIAQDAHKLVVPEYPLPVQVRHYLCAGCPFRTNQHENRQIALGGAVQNQSSLLVEQIAVDDVAADEIVAVRPLRPVGLQDGQFLRQDGHLRLVLDLGLQPALAIDGMPDKVRSHGPRDAIQHQGQQDGTEAVMSDHAAMVAKHG